MDMQAGLMLLLGLIGLGLASSVERPVSSSRLPSARDLQSMLLPGGLQAAGDEAEDEPAEFVGVPAPDAYDGIYAGGTTTREDRRVVTFHVTVRNGVGIGSGSRLDCGTVPLALRISPRGDVRGHARMFGQTCLKTQVALRGRAIGRTLQLRLGTQYLELSRSD
jgi:hypothetical protein